VRCAHVEHDGERGAGTATAADRRRRGTELSRRAVPPITMTAVWGAGLGGLLLLCLGALVGNSWTDQALGRRYQRLAIERRELNEWRRALQEASPRCVWCGNPMALSTEGRPEAGDRVSATACGDPSPAGTARTVGARR